MNSDYNRKGVAYGFFQCDASKAKVESELPYIRNAVGTPSKLELSLTEGMDNVVGDKKLVSLSTEAKDAGMNYMIQAKYSGANIEVADEVATILNQASQSSLYEKSSDFNGAVVYEKNGEYIFRE